MMMRTLAAALGAATVASGVLAGPTTTVLSRWTFEVSIPITAGPHAAEEGLFGGDALGVHASKATVYSNPVGNGSLESFSANNWSAGDAYVFTTSTLGFEQVTFTFSQTRSSTGPSAFVAEWSADGKNYDELGAYTVAQITFSSMSFNPKAVYGPFALPAEADDLETVWVRVRAAAPGSAAAGTNRIDDVTIEGIEIEEGCQPGEPCGPDLDGNGTVDGADLAILLGAWGTAGPLGDLDESGAVDGADLAILLGGWSA
jgi:hypothetical protein